MNLFSLFVELDMDTTNFDSKVSGALSSLTTLGNQLGGSSSSSVGSKTIVLGNMLTTVGAKAVDAAGKLATMGFEYNAQIEKYKTDFATVLGSEEKAAAYMADLEAFARRTSFDLPGLASASQGLLAAGISAEELLPTIEMLGTVAMGDAERLEGMAVALAQIQSKGRLLSNDLNQLSERGFNPLQEIAEQTGISLGDLRAIMAGDKLSDAGIQAFSDAASEVAKLGDDASVAAKAIVQLSQETGGGTFGIPYETVIRGFRLATEEGGRFFGSLENAATTQIGQTERLKESFSAFMGQISQPVSDVISEKLLPSANDLVDTLSGAHEQGGFRGLLSALTTTGAQGLEDGVNSAIGVFNKLFETDVEEIPWLSEATVSALGNLSLFLTDAANAAQLLVQSVVSFTEEHPFIVDAIGAVGLVFAGLSHPIGLAAAAVALLVANWDSVKTAVGGAWLETKSFLGATYENKVKPIVDALTDAFKNLWANIVGVGDAIAELFGIKLDTSITGGTPYDPVPPTVSGGLGDYSQGWGDDYITGGGPITDYLKRNLSGEPEGYRPSWNELTPGITTGNEVYGPVQQGVTFVQNIYSPEKSAADLMREARWQFELVDT